MTKEKNGKGYTVLEILIVLAILTVLLVTVFMVSVYRARHLRDRVRESEEIRNQTDSKPLSPVSLGQRLSSFRKWLNERDYRHLSQEHRQEPVLYRISQGIFYEAQAEKENNRIAESLLRRALMSFKAGDPQSALTMLKQAGTLTPLNPKIYVELARIGLALKQDSFALEQIKQALDIEPKYATAYLIQARIMLFKKDFKAAHAALLKSSTLKHKNPEYFLVWSEYHLKLGNLEKSEEFANSFRALM